MVWLAWVYTTWVTNWMDPDKIPVRVMLLVLTLISLVLAFALPEAFAGRGLIVGIAYAVSQIGRCIFAVVGLRGALQRNFERILCWVAVSGRTRRHRRSRPRARASVLLVARRRASTCSAAGPASGRRASAARATSDWTIDGGHFAERCQAFLLIALGESVVADRWHAQRRADPSATQQAIAFVTAFLGAAAFWWLYFDRSADEGMDVIGHSTDPGRLGRSAYHLIHPIMIAGIITAAAADEVVLSHPAADCRAPQRGSSSAAPRSTWPAIAAFNAVVWRVAPGADWSRSPRSPLLGVVATARQCPVPRRSRSCRPPVRHSRGPGTWRAAHRSAALGWRMDLDLQGRTAVITGASRGIGLAIVKRSSAKGLLVVAASRGSRPSSTRSSLAARCRFVEADLSDLPGRDEPRRRAGATHRHPGQQRRARRRPVPRGSSRSPTRCGSRH